MNHLPKPRSGKTHPFTNAYRLWRKGHRICGHTAWRLRSKDFPRPSARWGHRKLNHHAKYPASVWIPFRSDYVYVRQKEGGLKRYNRSWFLPFLAKVWMGQGFSSTGATNALRNHYGLIGNHWYCHMVLRWAILKHYEEVKDYLMRTYKVDLNEYFRRHDENTKFFEKVREDGSCKMGERLEAANGAERALGRIISIEAEMDKKAKQEDDFQNTKNEILSAIQSVKEESSDKSD